jgi:integrase
MAWGGDAMMHSIESYLQLRRAAGFQLRDTEALLKEFAYFAAERGDAHIKTDTAVAWAGRATSLNQRARRLNSLILFARYIRAEDTKHEIPPNGIFAHHPYSRPRPHIFTTSEIAAILPHVCRHTCALNTLQATGDIRKVALWLGHESIQSTEAYLRADPSQKREMLEAVLPPSLRRGRFRPADKLIASFRRK